MRKPANKAVKLSVRSVTRVANGATRTPARPAAYGRRWTATGNGNRNDVGIEQVRRLLCGQDRAGSHQTFTRHRRKGRTPLSYARCGRCNRTKAGLSLRSTRAYLDGENR